MSRRQFIEALLFDRPYLGPMLRAGQGVPRRHAYMQALVEWLARHRPGAQPSVLEVGSWAGGSTITWGQALRKYCGSGRIVCVDPWRPYFDPQVESAAIYAEMNRAAASGAVFRLFQHNIRASGLAELVVPMIGTSREVLPTLRPGSFAIAFLDGSHLYPDVAEDIRLAIPLLADGGVICGDDLELQAFQVDPAELRRQASAGRDYVGDPATGVSYHPGVTLAVAEAFPAVSAWEGFWAVERNADGWRTIDLEGCRVEVPPHLLSEPEASSDIDPYQDQDGPRLLDACGEFNVVRYGDRVYGLRQAIGPVDVSVGPDELRRRYSPEDIVIGSSPDGVRVRIEIREMAERLEQMLRRLADGVTALEDGRSVVVRRAARVCRVVGRWPARRSLSALRRRLAHYLPRRLF